MSRSSTDSSSSSSSSSSSEDKAKKSIKLAKKLNGTGGKDANDSDSDGSMLDLRENLKPIGAYIKDRERMLDEMLRCIKGKKLEAMLPDILKVFRNNFLFKIKKKKYLLLKLHLS